MHSNVKRIRTLPLVVVIAICTSLYACGKSDETTPGGAHSVVQGNIVTVIARSYGQTNMFTRVLAFVLNIISGPADAETHSLTNIRISTNNGGSTMTDKAGNFALAVSPGNTVFTFTTADGRTAKLSTDVPPGSTVVMKNITLNARNGNATAGEVNVVRANPTND